MTKIFQEDQVKYGSLSEELDFFVWSSKTGECIVLAFDSFLTKKDRKSSIVYHKNFF